MYISEYIYIYLTLDTLLPGTEKFTGRTEHPGSASREVVGLGVGGRECARYKHTADTYTYLIR